MEQRVGPGFGMDRRILLGPKVWRPEKAGVLLLLLLLFGVFCCCCCGCLFDVCFGSKPISPGSIPVA